VGLVAEEARDPDRDRCPCDYNKLVELTERVARLEEDNRWLKRRLEDLDSRTWWILGGVVLTVLIEVLDILTRLPIAH
jgi:hypothetical protein